MQAFVKICDISELEENKGYKFPLDDFIEVAVFKTKNKIYVVDNVCPHNHTPKMFNGFIKKDFIVCPVHFYEFNLKSGKAKNFLGGNLNIYETKIENDILFVKPKESKFDFNF